MAQVDVYRPRMRESSIITGIITMVTAGLVLIIHMHHHFPSDLWEHLMLHTHCMGQRAGVFYSIEIKHCRISIKCPVVSFINRSGMTSTLV